MTEPLDPLEPLFSWLEKKPVPPQRPIVTLTYAQSVDGSITHRKGEPLKLSSPASMKMTHRLRATHNGILVGIGTVIADNPSLTVRFAEGTNPQPIVLDSFLRTPLDCYLLQNEHSPWIITSIDALFQKQVDLEQAGARVFRLPNSPEGGIDLETTLQYLLGRGIQRLIVEGGAEIIQSFLKARLVDQVVLTIAPMLVGGLSPIIRSGELFQPPFPRIANPQWTPLEEDLILWGDLQWETK
jgi:3,4-dihydroxy 2-butanone 4-phosphate synthase/GTP cyclohydrolase II